MEKQLLSSLIVLRQKIHSFHWEVVGPSFTELHNLFGTQYGEVLLFADRVAEYIRTTGGHPPCRLSEMLRLSLVQEEDADKMSSDEMIASLSSDFKMLADMVNNSPDLSRAWSSIADDLHEYLIKQHWFLRSYLE